MKIAKMMKIEINLNRIYNNEAELIIIILMRKGFIVRDRSVGSLPSKQVSINEFMT